MKRMMITESVRNLLLDSDFLESVLGSPIVEPDANSGRPASSRKFEKMYLPAEIEQANMFFFILTRFLTCCLKQI